LGSVKWNAHRWRLPHPLATHRERALTQDPTTQNEAKSACASSDRKVSFTLTQARFHSPGELFLTFFFTVYRSCAISIRNSYN